MISIRHRGLADVTVSWAGACPRVPGSACHPARPESQPSCTRSDTPSSSPTAASVPIEVHAQWLRAALGIAFSEVIAPGLLWLGSAWVPGANPGVRGTKWIPTLFLRKAGGIRTYVYARRAAGVGSGFHPAAGFLAGVVRSVAKRRAEARRQDEIPTPLRCRAPLTPVCICRDVLPSCDRPASTSNSAAINVRRREPPSPVPANQMATVENSPCTASHRQRRSWKLPAAHPR